MKINNKLFTLGLSKIGGGLKMGLWGFSPRPTNQVQYV